MDELELLGRFRNDTPDPDGDSTAYARAALRTAMERTSRRAPRAPRRLPRRAWGAASVVLSAAIVITLAAQLLIPNHSVPVASAAEMLRRAARAAARQPTPILRAGQYVYTRSESAYEACTAGAIGSNNPVASPAPQESATACTLERFTREFWISPEGAGRIREVGDRTTDETFGPDGRYFQDLSTVPTDIDALRGYVKRQAGSSDKPIDVQMFSIVLDLLRETHATPELRAALYEVAATLPRTELIGETTDELGRLGIAVGYTYLGVRHELIFDPSTSAILGERLVQVDAPMVDASPAPDAGINLDGVSDPGTVLGWSSVVATGIVDSTQERT
jgi:hypothetical protein